MGAVSLVIGYLAYYHEDGDLPWQTMVFTTLVLSQMGNALAIRSSRDSLFTIGIFSNRLMVFAVLSTFALQLALIYIPFFQNIFDTQPLSAAEFGICLVASLALFGIVEVYKWVRRR